MRKLDISTVQQMIADRAKENAEEMKDAEVESPMVTVSVIDLLFWGGEIFAIGACASLLIALLLK